VKLALVRHNRCGEQEWDYATYAWVSDEMTEEQFYSLVCLAKESYLKAEKELNQAMKPMNPGYQPSLSEFPDKTVREVQGIHAERKKAWQAHEKKRDAARQPFSKHLVLVSNGSIKDFYEVEPPLVAEASWGHRHGTVIDYGSTKVNEISEEENED